MSGIHPTTGVAKDDNTDLDHYDPIQHDNVYTRMLLEQFPNNKWMHPLLLSNLLVYMSTGQGLRTKDFVKRENLWFTSAESCIKTFKDALAKSKVDKGSKCFNVHVRGTACASFCIESQKFTVEEKFTPFFSKTVLNAWQTYLDDH
jgi:hypothetical protein